MRWQTAGDEKSENERRKKPNKKSQSINRSPTKGDLGACCVVEIGTKNLLKKKSPCIVINTSPPPGGGAKKKKIFF